MTSDGVCCADFQNRFWVEHMVRVLRNFQNPRYDLHMACLVLCGPQKQKAKNRMARGVLRGPTKITVR